MHPASAMSSIRDGIGTSIAYRQQQGYQPANRPTGPPKSLSLPHHARRMSLFGVMTTERSKASRPPSTFFCSLFGLLGRREITTRTLYDRPAWAPKRPRRPKTFSIQHVRSQLWKITNCAQTLAPRVGSGASPSIHLRKFEIYFPLGSVSRGSLTSRRFHFHSNVGHEDRVVVAQVPIGSCGRKYI